jgi:hypothetical protein
LSAAALIGTDTLEKLLKALIQVMKTKLRRLKYLRNIRLYVRGDPRRCYFTNDISDVSSECKYGIPCHKSLEEAKLDIRQKDTLLQEKNAEIQRYILMIWQLNVVHPSVMSWAVSPTFGARQSSCYLRKVQSVV